MDTKMNEILKKIEEIKLIPVVKLNSVENAVPLAKALLDGGINACEITFRTEAAFEGIKTIKKAFPKMLIGAGTVINIDYAKKALEAGADFLVSPGFNPKVIDFVLANGKTMIPGISNSSEIEFALEKGLSYLKFFPAEALGGVKMLKAFSGPFSDVRFMPTGGISLDNMETYLKCENVFAIGGSWMIKDDFELVTKLSSQVVEKLKIFSACKD